MFLKVDAVVREKKWVMCLVSQSILLFPLGVLAFSPCHAHNTNNFVLSSFIHLFLRQAAINIANQGTVIVIIIGSWMMSMSIINMLCVVTKEVVHEYHESY